MIYVQHAEDYFEKFGVSRVRWRIKVYLVNVSDSPSLKWRQRERCVQRVGKEDMKQQALLLF
jgi:hypothetical protein